MSVRPLRRSRSWARSLTRGLEWALAGGLSTLVPAAVHGADDDWALERRDDDPALVRQRLQKLSQRPFDTAQWNAVTRALGAERLARAIATQRRRTPQDPAWIILEARAQRAQGDPTAAVATLATLERVPAAWEGRLFDLRVSCWVEAQQPDAAITALEARAEQQPATATATLERAYEIAEAARRYEEAVRLAAELAKRNPSRAAQLRLARAATSAGQPEVADQAYAEAAGEAADDDLIAERAQARLAHDRSAGAIELLWSLLEPQQRGSARDREAWWSMLVQAHRRQHTTALLASQLETWLQRHPGELAAWRTLALVQQSIGVDPTAAWSAVLTRAPGDAEAYEALLEAQYARGDIDAALRTYESLLRRHPRAIEPGLDLANRLVATGRHEQGFALAGSLRARVRGHAREQMLLLDFFNLNGEPDIALDIAEEVVRQHPGDPQARIALGEQLYQMGRVDDAVAQWERLPQLIRPAHRGYARLAEVLSEHERTTEAVDSIKRAMMMAPSDPAYLRTRAMLAEEQRRPAQALRLWEQVHQSAGQEHRLLRDEARTRIVELLVGGALPQRRARLQQATVDATERLARGTPHDDAVEAGRFLAELHTRQENYAAAVEAQTRLLALQPGDPERLDELAAAQRRAGDTAGALATLERLIALDPARAPEVLATMSELAFEAGDSERALSVATRAAERDHDQVEALVRLGELHERRGDLEPAARAYGRALETAPADSRARLRLAELELTRGRQDRAAALLREALERGGPPELLRDVGSRALDLAEATSTLPELLGMAVGRTSRFPEADEPREFLLETLDRMGEAQIRGWLGTRGADDRVEALRTPLLVALQRGSVRARQRAAEHLGTLGLPQTAVPLVTMAATLTPPRDATETVREAFVLARLTAVRAAGRLRDPQAVPAFAALLERRDQPSPLRRAAAWGLAWSATPEATVALLEHLRDDEETPILAVACLALAQAPSNLVQSVHVREAADRARDAEDPHLRRACAFAEAARLPDAALDRMTLQLESSDPMLAAIAAWRLGQNRDPSPAVWEALYRRVLGPPGMPRDAATASLVALLVDRVDEASPPAPADTLGVGWGMAVDRWLRQRVAPHVEPVDPEALAGSRAQLRAALEAASGGTRAERAAARRAFDDCPSSPSRDHICLPQLAKGRIPLAER